MAELIGSHPVVVRRLLNGLRWSGLVDSRSGPNGGWAIAKDPSVIRIGDLARAMSNEQAAPTSALDELLGAAEEAYLACLERVTLADLAEGDHVSPKS